jgi:Glycosyl transferase family 2/Polysaccharide deacetylase
MLSWGQLAEVAERGVEIGAHSHTHPELDALVPKVLEREVVRPKRLLEERLGREVTSFAHPHGYANARLRQGVHAAGYRSACAVRNLASHPGEDRFFLARQTMLPTTGAGGAPADPGRPLPAAVAAARPGPAPGWRMVRRSRALLRRSGLAGRPDDRPRPRPAAGGGGRGAAGGGRAGGRTRRRPLPPGAGPGPAARPPPGPGRPRPRPRRPAGRGRPGRPGLGVAGRGHPGPPGRRRPGGAGPAAGRGHGRRPLPGGAPAGAGAPGQRGGGHPGPPRGAVACVEGLLCLDYPSYEILLVDNAPSSAATAEAVARRFGHLPQVRYLREDRPGLSSARNRGLAEAAGEVVAFTDDVLVDPAWLANLVAALGAAPHVACASGLILGRADPAGAARRPRRARRLPAQQVVGVLPDPDVVDLHAGWEGGGGVGLARRLAAHGQVDQHVHLLGGDVAGRPEPLHPVDVPDDRGRAPRHPEGVEAGREVPPPPGPRALALPPGGVAVVLGHQHLVGLVAEQLHHVQLRRPGAVRLGQQPEGRPQAWPRGSLARSSK